MRTTLFIIFLAAFAVPVHAGERPTGSVRGIIFDPSGQHGIAQALIRVIGTDRGGWTDEGGRFQIDRVPVGKQYLSILSLGMNEAHYDLTIATGDTTTIPPIYLRAFGLTEDEAAAESIGVEVPWGAGALTCEIRPARKVFHVGDHPDFVVGITNRGSGSLNLVNAVDGSEGGRFPRAKILIEGLDGGSLTRTSIAFCANTNYLSPEDFVAVGSGQTIDPYAKGWKPVVMNETFERPGKYRATFTYSTDQPDVRGWLGFGQSGLDPRMSGLFRKVPKVKLTATTEFTVAE